MSLATLRNDRMFWFRGTTIVDRWISRLRFSDCYSKLPLLPRLDAVQTDCVNRLREHGYVLLRSHIPPAALRTMQDEFRQALTDLRFEMPCLAQTRIDPQRDRDLIDDYLYASPRQFAARGLAFDRSEARDYDQVVRDFNPSTLTAYMLSESEAFRRAWLDPFLLGVVASYLGMVPKMAEAYVRRNFPSPYRTMNHFWHRDLNHKHFMIKAFIFLSDCTLDTGPHEYVSGSHRVFEPLNGRRYYRDDEVDAAWPRGSQRRIVSEVPAGTVLLEDTRGLHRADMPNAGYRDLGYATFVPMRDAASTRLYEIPRAACAQLSALQQSFVPRSNLV